MTWHIQVNGEAKGPYTDEQMKALCDTGGVTTASMVWQPGFPDWMPLGQTNFPYKPVATGYQAQPTAPGGFGAAPGPNPQWGAATATARDDLSMWGFFWRALTKNYAKFDGRGRRKEYWSFVLFYILFMFAFAVVGAFIDVAVGNIGRSRSSDQPIMTYVILALWVLPTLVPNFAVFVRRLHDIGLSGWFLLLTFVPYVGGFFSLICSVLPSQPKVNKWGASPV